MAKTSWGQKETGMAVAQSRKRINRARIKRFGSKGKQGLAPCLDKDRPAGSKVGNPAFDIHTGRVGEETYARRQICHKVTVPEE
jgi:hypothetical protein